LNTQHNANNPPPKTWQELVWRTRYFILAFVFLIPISLTVVIILYRDTVVDLLTNNIQVLREVQKLRSNPKPEPNFASFKTKWPQTDRGNPVNFFTDSSFSGK
jgi:hypothetical protein